MKLIMTSPEGLSAARAADDETCEVSGLVLDSAAAVIATTPPGVLLSESAIEALKVFSKRLREKRPDLYMILIEGGAELREAPEDEMRAAGWIRPKKPGPVYAKRSHERFDLDSRAKEVTYLIEADDFAEQALWGEWSNAVEEQYRTPSSKSHQRIRWSYVTALHEVLPWTDGGRSSLSVSLSFATLEGRLACFWSSPSQVVDHEAIRAWLTSRFPEIVDRSDANNFHVIAHRALGHLREPGTK